MFDASTSSSQSASEATRTRILDAAEAVFAERGFAGASLRAITSRADANVAAAHYHFGSKQELLGAVLGRRVDPINTERLERLAQLEEKGAPSLEALLDAFLRPSLTAVIRQPALRDVSALLFSEPLTLVEPLVADLFGEVATRFARALGRALPELPRAELIERFQYVVGTMIQAISGRPRLAFRASELDTSLSEDSVDRMVAFLAAGLRLPPAEAGAS